MSAWDEYVSAAQRLDAVRRSAAVAMAEQANVVRTAREELTGVRGRLTLQRARFADVASRLSLRLPALAPTPSEVDAAISAEAGPSGVLAVLHQARSTLDSADAELSAVDSGGPALAGRPAAVRNLVVYGAFALLTLVLQLVLFLVASEQSLPLLAPICGLVLPLLGFALGWLAIGLVYPTGPGATVDRTPLVGAVVCLVVPVLVTCAGFGIVALVR